MDDGSRLLPRNVHPHPLRGHRKKLGCGACMESLRRTAVGGFTLENSYTPDALRSLPADRLNDVLIPLTEVFSDLPVLSFPSESKWKRYANGERIPAEQLPSGGRYRVLVPAQPERLHSLAEVRNLEGGPKICSLIRFE